MFFSFVVSNPKEKVMKLMAENWILFLVVFMLMAMAVRAAVANMMHKENRDKIQKMRGNQKIDSRTLLSEHLFALRQQNQQGSKNLFFNMQQGIVVVLKPEDYQAALLRTEMIRQHETWPEKVLWPAKKSLIFVNDVGSYHIQSQDQLARRYKVAGSHVDLCNLCEDHGYRLIKDERIFIPWLNENLLKFADQHRLIDDCKAHRIFALSA